MTHRKIAILATTIAFILPVCANAQDFDSAETLKSDISKPELISLPPMDP